MIGNERRSSLWTGAVFKTTCAAWEALAETSRYKRFIGRLACFWYINEDIPDINLFSDSLGEKFTTVDAYTHSGYNLISSKHCAPPDKKTMEHLDFLILTFGSALRLMP